MEINDILKLLNLTQAEINALADSDGLYINSTTGKLNFNGSDMAAGGDMNSSVYDPNTVQDDAFDYGNFLGTFQIKGTPQVVSMSSDKDNLGVTSNIVNLTASSQDRRITGIVAPPAGVNRVICFMNTSSSFRIKFVHQSGSSLANNRIVLRGNAGTRNLLALQVGFAIYNHSINKWYITRIA